MRQLHPLPNLLLLLATLLLSTPTWSADSPGVGGQPAWQHYPLRHMDITSMDEVSYRRISRKNRGRVQRFIADYAESSLTSLGVPRKGMYVLGAVASVAATQDAKFYLSRSKLMAVEVKNITGGSRSIFLGFKVNW